jgi:L-lactate dehydrogenase complex protein LldF
MLHSATFLDRVEQAIGDAHLRAALDRATGQLGTRRVIALSTLDDSASARAAARAARMDAIANLADYLERFEARLIANGGHVHWADTAADANRIIVEIAKRAGCRRAVKSKSMVSEETHLNEGLEGAGIRVVETDLGEYIVQLRQDRPSHIVAPIIHLTRQDVGRVMHERLDVPFTDDAQALAAIARAQLRKEFLQADLGISGANFGVAETGTICLVTNEGNGRMVTTLPRVHIALVGIEKLVATMADLDRCLKVLARSATGQKITVYTTLISGPRGPADADGPEQFHVVLLDNGRSRILAGETAEILGCIRCGACLNACPVYRTIGGHAYGDTYPGPVGAIVTPGLRGLAGWRDLPQASSLCGACREVCPVSLDIPRMLLALRGAAAAAAHPRAVRWGLKSFAWLAVRPRAYRAVSRVLRWTLARGGQNGWIRRLPGYAGRWTLARDLKTPANVSFQQMWLARTRNAPARPGRSAGIA